MLEVFTLGGLEIRRDGKNITGLIPTKGQALIVYLAYSGREQSRSFLASLLWDGEKDRSANSLRATLTALRKETDAYLTIDRQTIGLQGEVICDAVQFHKRLPSEDALLMYEGEFLRGFTVNHASDFEEWMFQEREWLNVRTVEALHKLVSENLENQTYDTGVRWATRILQLDPFDEAALRQLMLLYARAGKRQEALNQFTHFKQLYEEEFGDSIQDETLALAEQIRQPQMPSTHSVVAVPQKQNAFVGREEELRVVSDFFTQPNRQRLITITGIGGAGKTRLAMEIAQQSKNFFPDGVYFVPLASADSMQSVPSSIVDMLQLPTMGDVVVHLTNYLRDKQMLLVLDNFEHLLDGVDFLLNLLQNAPNLVILVTSRERLNVQQEFILPLGGLNVKNHRESGAAKLFLERARSIRFDVAFSPHVIKICELLEGIPLAIELAASWVSMFSVEEICTKIQEDLDFLATTARDVPLRHRSMRVVFDHSWNLLNPDEQKILASLSLFRASFTFEAAQKITGASMLQLATLVQKSLVVGRDRYSLHEIMRKYGLEKLELMAHYEEASIAFVQYYLDYAEQYGPLTLEAQHIDAIHQLVLEQDNLRVAVSLSRDKYFPREMGLRFINALSMFWTTQIFLGNEEIVAIARELIGQAKLPSRDPVLCDALFNFSMIEWWIGRYDSAVNYQSHALDIASGLEDIERRITVLVGMGMVYMTVNDADNVDRVMSEAVEISLSEQDPEWVQENTQRFIKIMARYPDLISLGYMDAELLTALLLPINQWTLRFGQTFTIFLDNLPTSTYAQLRGSQLTNAVASFYIGIHSRENKNYEWALRTLVNALMIFYIHKEVKGLRYTLLELGTLFEVQGDEVLGGIFKKMSKALKNNLRATVTSIPPNAKRYNTPLPSAINLPALLMWIRHEIVVNANRMASIA